MGGTRERTLVLLLAAATPLAYVLYTGQVWEDYFITFRHSRNLAEGNGLVFQPGERVHGFTSPLGVLLPAAFHFVAGNPYSFLPALWMFRAVSIAAVACATWFLFDALTRRSRLAAWSAVALLAFETKTIAYSVNGQEQGLLVFFLAAFFWLHEKGLPERWMWAGLVWAGLQWTRPDGCMAIAASGLAALAFPNGRSRGEMLSALVKAGLLAILLYLPWLLWAWWYYGSPIPHTVIAKAGLGRIHVGLRVNGEPTWFGLASLAPRWTLSPIAELFGGWPPALVRAIQSLAVAGAFLWLIPSAAPSAAIARRLSLAYFLLCIYQDFAPAHYWYFPPLAYCLLGALAAGFQSTPRAIFLLALASYAAITLEAEQRLVPGHRLQNTLIFAAIGLALAWRFVSARTCGVALAVAAILALEIQFALQAQQIRVQQRVIEYGNRMHIGLWLRERVAPEETVYLECLGYIGYFSGCRMLDFPGLASPRVVAARRATGKRLAGLISELKPDWLVLRPSEVAEAESLGTLAGYWPVAEFDVGPELASYPNIAGMNYLLLDAKFTVYRRGDAAQEAKGHP